MTKARTGAFLLVVPAIFLLAAPLPWSYSYYVLLRWIVSPFAAYLAVRSFRTKQDGWPWIWGAIALLFNPITPVTLTRGGWIVPDLVAAGLFAYRAFGARRHTRVGTEKRRGPGGDH